MGTEVVENEGQVGSKDLIYEVTYNKGVEVSRKLVSETVTKAPINRVIVVGTKAKSEVTYGEEYTSIENEVAYETTYVENANLDKGVENVVTEGSNGFDTVVSRDVLENGVKVTTEVVSRQTTAAVTEVIEVGTKIPAMTIEALQATIDMELLNQEFLVLLNELRVSAGRGVVYYAAEYQDEADTRALEEVEQTVASFEAGNGWDIDHERTDGSAWYEVFENRNFSAGENLLGNSINYLDALTDIDEKALAKSMYEQWYASQGHRDNMVGINFSTNTVSVQLINVDGYVYYVGSELLTSDGAY